MDITYKWSIAGVDGTPLTSTNLAYVARAIHWRCSGTIKTRISSIGNNRMGFVILEEPTSEQQFTPYDEITEEIVFEWLFEKLDKETIESEIAEALSEVEELMAIENKTPLGLHWDSSVPVTPPVPPEAIIPPPQDVIPVPTVDQVVEE